MMTCKHTKLSYYPSEHAKEARYKDHSHATKQLARCTDRTKPPNPAWNAIFPSPLILPDDDLALDPDYSPQETHAWVDEPARNPVTVDRKTIYIVDCPSMQPEIEFISRWCWPKQHDAPNPAWPKSSDIANYIGAFYGLQVKQLASDTLRFRAWDENSRTLSLLKSGKLKKKSMIGLEIGSECLGIESRPCPDGVFERQLNLNHLLDAAIEILPSDAYAMLLLVHHDLYEDEDDDFCCGRAYGGSRVAVVSSARYNPVLDDVDLHHTWPNSHCMIYMKTMTGLIEKTTQSKHDKSSSPLRMASDAVAQFRKRTEETNLNKWLGRFCRTASHELGHCFGIDHCVFYACAMQGTVSIGEDYRQPPYLCPVDAAKVSHATGISEQHHLLAMLHFCDLYPSVELFVAYAAWIRGRLNEIERGHL